MLLLEITTRPDIHIIYELGDMCFPLKSGQYVFIDYV